MKYYIVPESDIETLETARVALCNAESWSIGGTITQAMWKITHRRYSRAYFGKLILKLTGWKLWRKR